MKYLPLKCEELNCSYPKNLDITRKAPEMQSTKLGLENGKTTRNWVLNKVKGVAQQLRLSSDSHMDHGICIPILM